MIDTRDFRLCGQARSSLPAACELGLSTTSIYFQRQDIARDECNPPGHVLS